jgi:subtilisin family serine protease
MRTKCILSACTGLLATCVAMSQQVIPNDPEFGQQWALQAIGATNAWTTSTGSSNVVVAVISTGIRYNHEDLAANMWRNPGEIPDNGIDDDANGYVDDIHGIDLVDGDSDPMDVPSGPYYRGTEVGGAIGAVGNNGLGITGLNWSVKLMALRYVPPEAGPGFVSSPQLLESQAVGLNYVRQLKERGVNIRVVCFALIGFASDPAQQKVKDALQELGNLGVVAVAVVGGIRDNDSSPTYPACYNLPNLISVTGSTQSGELYSVAAWGRTNVHLAAPVDVIRTTSGGATDEYVDSNAFTTPAGYVAGAAALLTAAWPAATPAQIKTALLESVDLVPALTNKVVSHGRLNVGRAMDSLIAMMTLPRLSIARSGSNALLTWPTSAASALVEQTSTLFPQEWRAVSGPRETNGLSITINVPIADGAFFRLHQP